MKSDQRLEHNLLLSLVKLVIQPRRRQQDCSASEGKSTHKLKGQLREPKGQLQGSAWEQKKTNPNFQSQLADSETAAHVTADPLANLKADCESIKADCDSQLGLKESANSKTAALVTADPLATLKAGFKSLIAGFKSQLDSQQMKADFESQL